MIVLRILLFILLAVPMGFTGAWWTGMDALQQSQNYGWVGLLIGAGLAWLVSGMPFRKRDAKFNGPFNLTLR